MNLFDQLVTEALKNQLSLSSLRVVVEKELLHHDILRILNENNLLSRLTFIGGTCLRMCYGGMRLSEDLDFTGGEDFSRENLATMGHLLASRLHEKYGLRITVSEPIKDTKNVNTWKIKIETAPEQKHLPAQRINIDICSVRSYEARPMLLMNPYGVDMGTNGLIIRAESREEIYADKLLAFALRPNRLKYRDLWDIVWLQQQTVKPKIGLIPLKLKERHLTVKHFLDLFIQRQQSLVDDHDLAIEFKKEMHRFLPSEQIKTIEQDDFWRFMVYLLEDVGAQLRKHME